MIIMKIIISESVTYVQMCWIAATIFLFVCFCCFYKFAAIVVVNDDHDNGNAYDNIWNRMNEIK